MPSKCCEILGGRRVPDERADTGTVRSPLDNFRFKRFEVRPVERSLLVDGVPATLGTRAFDLLLALIERRDRVTGAQELLERVWPGLVVEENNLRQQISTLRRVLGPATIATVARRGYRLVTDEEPDASSTVPVPAATVAAEAAAAVRRALTMRPIVGVMPFASLSLDAQQDYLADAIAQDIITGLSKHRWITVLARGTTFGYRHAANDVRTVARELGADYVVGGSVRRIGDRVRINVELVDGGAGTSLWAERYDGARVDVHTVLDEVTDTIVGCLEPEIGHAERRRVGARPKADLLTWDRLHLGLAHLFRFTAVDNAEALRLFSESRSMDPDFGEAHAWWAYASVLGMVYWDRDASRQALDAALAAAQRALELDDQNAVFFALKARVQVARQACDSAVHESRMAIQLNPTLAVAHCGLGDALAYLGRHDEAMACFERALTLSPRDPQRWAFLTYGALALILHGEPQAALCWAAEAEEIPNCSYWTPAHVAVALAQLGRPKDAAGAVERLLAKQPSFSQRFAEEKLFYLRPEQRSHYVDGLLKAGIGRGA
jgi:adenylate cyclase